MFVDVAFWAGVLITAFFLLIWLILSATYSFSDGHKTEGYLAVISIFAIAAVIGKIVMSGFWDVVLGL